jgi:hypothetical protein
MTEPLSRSAVEMPHKFLSENSIFHPMQLTGRLASNFPDYVFNHVAT